MDRPKNALDVLKQLRELNGKEVQNFRSIHSYLQARAKEKGVPLHGQFELTPLCNFSCKMCYVHLNPEQLKGHRILSPEEWKEQIFQAYQEGMMLVTLTGGECLAYPGFEDVFLFCHSLGCEVGILTNGFLLNEQRIQFFREHMPTRIQVTLYGWNDDVYERVTGQRAFTTVTENVRRAIDAGLPVTVNLTPNVFLGEDALETLRVCKSLTEHVTVNAGLFTPREETGRSDQVDDPEQNQYIRIFRLYGELNGREIMEIPEEDLPPAGGPFHECSECGLRCGGGRSSFVMNWQGEVAPCNRLQMVNAVSFSIGFKAAWKKVNQEACSWPQVPECNGCPYDKICNNCAGHMLEYAEPGKLPKALCEQTRKYVSRGVRLLPECD